MKLMEHLPPAGTRVRILRQIPHRDRCWVIDVEGTLVSVQQMPTGAWYAHARKNKLWLDRAMIRTDDGEYIDCILDRYTRIEWSDIAA